MPNRFRSKNLSIRVTQNEYELIHRKVKQAKMSLRKYLATCMLNKEIIIKEGNKELFTQIKKIGINLNQIAHGVNRGIITDCSIELTKIWQELKEVTNKWQ